jgi:hypothetical protein
MIMTPRLRKFVLTAHVTSSVGWLGAVAVFLALAVIGLTSQDAETVRAVYLVMEPAAWFVLAPLAFALRCSPGWSSHWARPGACSGTIGSCSNS